MLGQTNFLEKQLTYQRVKLAFTEKEDDLKKDFEAQCLTWPPEAIYIRSFKSELELELWVYEKDKYFLFRQYDVCAGSGSLGPKKQTRR